MLRIDNKLIYFNQMLEKSQSITKIFKIKKYIYNRSINQILKILNKDSLVIIQQNNKANICNRKMNINQYRSHQSNKLKMNNNFNNIKIYLMIVIDIKYFNNKNTINHISYQIIKHNILILIFKIFNQIQ